MMNPSGSRRLEYLEAMGIQAWSLRALPAAVPEAETSAAAVPAIPVEEAEALPGVAVPVAELRRRPDVSRLDWDELQAQVAGCTLCELHSSRTQTVFGVGMRATTDAEEEIDIDAAHQLAVVDFEGYSKVAYFPYEVLVDGGNIEALHMRFRMAVHFPDLSMMGKHGFMKLMASPGATEDALRGLVASP